MPGRIVKDIAFFGLPGLAVLAAGLHVAGRDGFGGITRTLWQLIREPELVRDLTVWNLAGFAVFALGIGFAVRAQVTLGRFYSGTLRIREGHRVVREGLFRHVRHPIYLGVLVAIQGVSVFTPSWRSALVFLLLVPIVVGRIRREERMLVEELGDEYRDYQRSVPMLVPGVF